MFIDKQGFLFHLFQAEEIHIAISYSGTQNRISAALQHEIKTGAVCTSWNNSFSLGKASGQ